MFIDMVRVRRLTPPGVICYRELRHGTPGGVWGLVACWSINMALLAECSAVSHDRSTTRRSESLRFRKSRF